MSDTWTLENIVQVRDEIRATNRATPARDEQFHEAAALVSSFAIAWDGFTGPAASNLIADSVPTKEGSRWTLKSSVRRRVLRQLRSREALQNALRKTKDRPDDPLQHAIEECLSESSKPLQARSPEELAALMQVVDWFGETELKDSLPTIDGVRQRVEYAALLEPLQALAGASFYGRKLELAALGSYVDRGEGEKKPMLIFGPGGMGKSSLLAKFVLDRIGRLPVVYLDCDRPGLAPHEPLTFLAEAVRQLGLQFESFRSPAENLRNEWLRSIALTQTDNANTRGRAAALEEFRVFVNDIGVARSPVLFAIDTFEEVQYRSRSIAREVSEFLRELRERLPNLRTVIAGRNPTPEFEVSPLELGELDQEASRGLLGRLGVKSSDVQARLARLLHGNPLSIRLAAGILQTGDTKDWTSLEGITDDTEIQGILYGRILGHIHEQDVRKIAHPGLILRRITVELIREVLAEPCGVKLNDPKDADALFTKLRSELSLVVPEGNAVRHRPDVRRVMLEPLRNDRKDVVRQIEERAIKYYLPLNDPTSRAEEIYHRLSLGQSRQEIDARWLPGIEDSLRPAIEELPKTARTFLAARLGMELHEDWDSVDQNTWEEYVARQCGDLLKLDRPLEAVRLLRRRWIRLPNSRLYWFHAQALRRAGQLLESREIARQALEPHIAESFITLELLDWFSGPELRTAPSERDVIRQVASEAAIRPLQEMTEAVFVGREQELGAITGYVFEREISARPMLAICGPGGIGKSALVAKFVLARRDALDPVFINLDAPSHNPSAHIESIWKQLYEQLALMWPDSRSEPAAEGAIDVPQLRRLLESKRDRTRPVLAVIDTSQPLSEETIERLCMSLKYLQAQAPFLRLVLVTRTPPDNPDIEVISIGALPTEAANSLLIALGIDSTEVREKLLRVAGSSPLTLRLAADLVQRSSIESLDGLDVEGTGGPLPGLAVHLLSRVLDRILDSEVRAVSRAGLAVRRITAEVIERVLSRPLQLTIDRAHARALLESLAIESSMFARIDIGVIRTRPEFRQLLRKLAGAEHAAFIRAIDEAAVAFYQVRDEPEFRAEEIFHRMMLGQSTEEIDGRWIEGVEQFLQDVASDVSGELNNYLAVRLGLADADIDPATADQATWEVYVAKRARAFMDQARLVDALELVRQRSTRMRRSPLYAIEAQILASMARWRESLMISRRGLELWPDDKALISIVGAAEQALGVEERHAQSSPASMPTQSNYFLRDDVSADEVLEALGVALPTQTDSINAFRPLHWIPPEAMSSLESIVKFADQTHRMDELIAAVMAYREIDPVFEHFLSRRATKLDSSSADPISRVLLERGQVFFDRQILRDFLRDLVSGEARTRVLVVTGPPGSGKSFTGALVDSVARATGRLSYRRFDLTPTQWASELIHEVFDALQWRSELPEPRGEQSRYIHEIANVIRYKSRQSRSTIVLHFDIEDQPNVEAIELIRELIARPDRIAIILSGPPIPLEPPDAMSHVALEEITSLSITDIEDGLLRMFRELRREATDSQVAAIARAIVAHSGAKEGDRDFNAKMQESIKAAIASL